jgi:prophage regulatory protein
MSNEALRGASMVQRILRVAAVRSATGDSKSGHYAKINAGLFTRPVKIGARASGWPESEVAAIQAARIAGKSSDEIRALVRKLEAARESGFEAVAK